MGDAQPSQIGNGVTMPKSPEQDESARTQGPARGQTEHSFLGGSPFGSAAGNLSENEMFRSHRGRAPRLTKFNEGAAGMPSSKNRKYYMESEIFEPNHSTYNNYEPTAVHHLDPAAKGREMGAAGRATVVQHMDWFGRDANANTEEPHQISTAVIVPDVDYENQYEETHLAARGNARENSGNPITGQGYKEDEVSHSKRRQYAKPVDAKLW